MTYSDVMHLKCPKRHPCTGSSQDIQGYKGFSQKVDVHASDSEVEVIVDEATSDDEGNVQQNKNVRKPK